MSPHKNTQIGVAALVAALAASGAAVAATKLHHSSSGLRTGVIGASSLGFVRSQSGPGQCPGMGHRRSRDLEDAASYLGIAPAALLTQLQAGKTLAQVADATSGKSAAGLVDALVADETTAIKAAVTAGTLTQAQADELLANLKAHETAEVNGTFEHDRGPGGPPPSAPGGTHV
jgi:hypothetical protein